MRKYVLVFMVCLVAVGCGNTKVFMGSYDSVKITVSGHQAQMTAENFPSETQSLGEKLERKISAEPICVGTKESDFCKTGNTQGKLQVTIVCSDEGLIREFSNNFYERGFAVEKRLRKPSNKSTIISKVTIYPKRKHTSDTDGGYHLIEFETMGGLAGGTHRLFVKGPLAFMFKLMKIKDNIKKITMLVTYSNIIKNCNFIIKENDTILSDNSKFKVLSEIISTTEKPISVVFVRIY